MQNNKKQLTIINCHNYTLVSTGFLLLVHIDWCFQVSKVIPSHSAACRHVLGSSIGTSWHKFSILQIMEKSLLLSDFYGIAMHDQFCTVLWKLYQDICRTTQPCSQGLSSRGREEERPWERGCRTTLIIYEDIKFSVTCVLNYCNLEIALNVFELLDVF